MGDKMTNKQQEDFIKKVKKGDSILVIGEARAGKTELLNWLAGGIEASRRTVTIGYPGEIESARIFYPYGGKHTSADNYLKLNPEWLLYDGIRGVDDLFNVFTAWQRGTRVIATLPSETVYEAGATLEELGERLRTAYGTGMDEYIRMFDTVVTVQKGWGGTPWEVTGSVDTNDVFAAI